MRLPLLELRDVTYRYSPRQERPSLDRVSLSIEEGVRTVILGANGAGKSTLFYHLNGVLKPAEGQVLYCGSPLDYSKEALRRLRSEVSVVVQNPDEQIFSSTVEEDVAFGPLNMDLPRDEVERRVDEALYMVGMDGYRTRPTVQLSYGQRKRVAIAGALAVRPRVMIMDEPTAGLDPQMSHEVLELAEQLCRSGTTVIVSTHDVDLAYTWAERIHVLRNGKAVYSGPPEGFFGDSGEVSLAGLARPRVFSVNSAVCAARGISESPYPRTMSQLLCRLAGGSLRGTIRVATVPEDVSEGTVVGVCGYRTRRAFSEGMLRADFFFNAVECCLMEALTGKDCVLFCDPGMEESVIERIRRSEGFGDAPEVLV